MVAGFKWLGVTCCHMSYLRNRLIQAGVTMYGVVTLTFFLNKFLPGGPEEFLRREMRQNPSQYGLRRNPSQEAINQRLEAILGTRPDQPLIEQYFDYLFQVFVRFDFGQSITVSPGGDVLGLVLQRAPWTVFIVSIAMTYGIIAGFFLGAFMAYKEGTKFDVSMTIGMILNSAVPYYAVAILLLYFLAYQYGWFPTGGRLSSNTTPGINWPFIAGVLEHATLPSLSLILTGLGGGALGLRANAIRLLGSDQIRNARLRGLSPYRISTAYIGRNAVLPMYTSIVISIGALLGGSVILEEIFTYPGVGLLLFDAAVQRDFPLLMGGLVLTTALFVFGTLIADFTYSLIDPRAEQASRE